MKKYWKDNSSNWHGFVLFTSFDEFFYESKKRQIIHEIFFCLYYKLENLF